MRVLITGGLGFIGVNTAIELFKDGNEIFIIDNLSRKGNIENLTHLQENINLTIWNRDI
jgi:CDP-paratose 2-epimerase